MSLYCRSITFDNSVTPYIHVFIFHTCQFLRMYGSLQVFDMENVEYLNYHNKLVFFGASNKGKEQTQVTDQVIVCNNISMQII